MRENFMANMKKYVKAREAVGPQDQGLFTFLFLEALEQQASDEEWEAALKEATNRTQLYQEVVPYIEK
jgi:hypothetical protein